MGERRPAGGRPPIAPARPEPAVAPVREEKPAAPVREVPSPQELMEEAILAEPDHPEQIAIHAESQAAASALSDSPWEHETDALAVPEGARIGSSLVIASVGEVRTDGRSVRIPLVLGDGEGGTSSVVLTVRIDPLAPESGD